MKKLSAFAILIVFVVIYTHAQGFGPGGAPGGPGAQGARSGPGQTAQPGTQQGTLQGAPQSAPANRKQSGPFQEAVAETRTSSISVGGRLEPQRRIVHTAGISGFVDEVHVKVGERVREGQALATLVRDTPGESYRPFVVLARISGLVSEIQLTEGAEIKAGANVATLIDDSAYKLVALLSDKDAFRAAAMPQAELTGRTAGNIQLKGRLVSVSAEPEYSTGLFRAELRFLQQANARPGMILFIDLPVDSVRGVFVKQNLIVRRFGRNMLWVLDKDQRLQLASIITSKTFGDDALISSGLSAGSFYLTKITGYEKEGLELPDYLEALKKGQ